MAKLRRSASGSKIAVCRHGTNDATVDFAEAENLRAAYEVTGVPYAWHPLEGVGHGAWRATIDGAPLVESAAEFIVEIQDLDRR